MKNLHSGKEQAQEGQIKKEHDQKRVNELDDQNDERDARNDRTTLKMSAAKNYCELKILMK